MSMQPYENPPPPALTRVSAERGLEVALSDPWDSWIYTFAQTVQLAQYIQHTEMVPKEIRGKPDAIAGIILAGREMQLPPFASLQHLFIVRGKPGQSAQMMRAKVLQAGHEIDYVEQTDTICIVRGRRRGTQEWSKPVKFTSDQAKKLGISLGGGGRDGGYTPEDKLVARATSRLCRRMFADCISSLPSVDELEDEELTGGTTNGAATSSTGRRAQRRRTLATGVPSENARNGDESAPETPEPPPATSGPDESAESASGTPEAPEGPADVRMAIQQQMRALGAIFTKTLKITDVSDGRDIQDRHILTSGIVGRLVRSWSELTFDEAGAVIDATGRIPRDEKEREAWIDAAMIRGNELLDAATRDSDAETEAEHIAEQAETEHEESAEDADGIEDADIVKDGNDD